MMIAAEVWLVTMTMPADGYGQTATLHTPGIANMIVTS